MENPKVSVLMPAYNAEKYIGEAIESILNQTFKDFEFIIIDDGSSDGTWNLIQEYVTKDKRIIALQNETNLGVSETRNKLISLAKGKYVVWQDADDISVPDRIQHQYAFMEIHPDVGIAGGFLQFFGDEGLRGLRKYAPDDQALRKTIFRYSPVAQPTAIIRTECFKKVGGFKPHFLAAEDLEMSFRIGQYYTFANLQEVTVHYREHGGGLTANKLRLMEKLTLQVRSNYFYAPGYSASFADRIFNLGQWISMYVIPSSVKVGLFNLMRNS